MILAAKLLSLLPQFRLSAIKEFRPLTTTERELRELRLKIEFYEDILNGLPNDLVVFDTEHRYLFLNKIAVRNDKTRRFMLGKTDFDYCSLKGVANDIALARHQQFREVILNGKAQTWEEVKSIDGWHEVINRTMRPVYDNLGQLKYVLGFGTDVSNLRQTEKRLREKVQELEQIMDNSFTAIAIADAYFKVMEWNKTAEQIFGYTAADIVGTCPGENLMLHKNPAAQENFCVQLVQNNDLLGKRFETDLQHKNGELRDVEILINPFSIGERTYHAIFLHDVTEKKQAQKAVQELATFPEEDPNIVFRIGAADFSLQYANPATRHLFGNEAGIKLFVHEKLYKVLRRTVESNAPERIEANFKNSIYTIAVWPNLADGYINLYATDISMVKEAEQQLQRLNSGLKEEVDKRTRELRESNRNLEHFAYSISHDLRAPLRHVLGYTSLLKEETGAHLSENAIEYIARTQQSARKMEKQISGLLEFSRFGTKKLNIQSIPLKALFDQAIEVFQNYYKPASLQYTNDADVYVMGDSALLHTVLENLVSNAIKYAMPKANVKIRITAEVKESETVVCICDNGVGFDMHYYDQIFGMFKRLHSEQEFEGLGLGLTHVQRIMERHGGRIWAESRLGEGSCFYFALPNIPVAA